MESAYQSEGTFSHDFTRLMQQISSYIQQITRNVTQISRSVALFGTAQDTQILRQKVLEIQHNTRTLCQSTMESLKSLSAMTPPPGISASQTRQWKLQKERLTNDFSVVLNNFQSAQRTAALKEKASVSRAKSGIGAKGASLVDSGDSPATYDQQSELQLQEHVDLQTIQERERGLRQLESDILNVNQIFKDLAVMIHQQGELVDSIEANVDSATIHVDRGSSNLRQASEYQRRARRKQIICAGVLMAVIIILSLIIYLSTRSGSSTE